MLSTSMDFGMKPEAPKSMARRITVGSSVADTITTGSSGYWALSDIRPEKPCTPGMVRSSRIRSTSRSWVRVAFRSSMPLASTHPGLRHDGGDGLPQGATKQRMVIGDNDRGGLTLHVGPLPRDASLMP